MSDQVTAPAGWYPDPNGAPTQRWWDGTNWTEHYAPGGPVTLARPQIPEDSRVDRIWVWLVAFLPLASIATYFLIDFGGYMRATMSGDVAGMFSSFGVGYLVALVLSWGLWGAAVLFAYFDWRDLRNVGVVRPFHWAWTFLGSIVYLIGRAVILRKVSKKGLPPLWVGIAVYVAIFVTSIVWSIWLTTEIMGSIYEYLPDYRYS